MNKRGMLYDFVQQANQEIKTPIENDSAGDKKINDVSDGSLIEEQKSITRLIPMDMSEGRLVEDEKCLTGHVPLYVFKDFIKKMGPFLFILFLMTNAIEQGLHAGGILWLSHWSDDSRVNSSHANDEASYRLGIYFTFPVLYLENVPQFKSSGKLLLESWGTTYLSD